jgi:hypothetical protein
MKVKNSYPLPLPAQAGGTPALPARRGRPTTVIPFPYLRRQAGRLRSQLEEEGQQRLSPSPSSPIPPLPPIPYS